MLLAPTWHSTFSAASPLLFSAFPCHPGTANRAPEFVTGMQSIDTNLRTEYTCHAQRACEIALFARDMNTAWPPQQTTDDIAIEAAIGFETLDVRTLFTPDGGVCQGTGAVHCIYKLTLSNVHDHLASTHIRCFTTFDMHDASAAPQQRSCRRYFNPQLINTRSIFLSLCYSTNLLKHHFVAANLCASKFTSSPVLRGEVELVYFTSRLL